MWWNSIVLIIIFLYFQPEVTINLVSVLFIGRPKQQRKEVQKGKQNQRWNKPREIGFFLKSCKSRKVLLLQFPYQPCFKNSDTRWLWNNYFEFKNSAVVCCSDKISAGKSWQISSHCCYFILLHFIFSLFFGRNFVSGADSIGILQEFQSELRSRLVSCYDLNSLFT